MDELKNAWERICQRAGISDLHIHDLRHEAKSRVADTGKFSLVDLQVFAGHRDPRSTLRYAHLCTKKLAQRLDEAFETEETSYKHKGRNRLKRGAPISMRDVIRETSTTEELAEIGRHVLRVALESLDERTEETLPDNIVIPFPCGQFSRVGGV